MNEGQKNVVVHAPITPAQREEMARILDRVVGTPIERTGDIIVETGGRRFVLSDQTGAHAAASVARDGGTEIVGSEPAYRRDAVIEAAEAGMAKVPTQARGEQFTLKSLSPAWDGLSATERRFAGRNFRGLIEAAFPGQFDSWTTSDNERHYRRR